MNYFEKLQRRQELLEALRAEELHAYKVDRENKGDLWLAQERFFGGHFYDRYKKEGVDLLHGDSLDVVTNQNINHDTALLWNTTGESVRLAVRSGQLKPEALTSKAVQAIGKYNKKCLDRKIKSRIQSTQHEAKKYLIDMAQDRIEALQGLERFLGHRVHDAAASFDGLSAVLQTYHGQQEAYLTDVALGDHYRALGYPNSCRNQIIKEDQAAAAELRTMLVKKKGDAHWLETTGYDAILTFIKQRTLAILRQTQALNQVLTHRRKSGAYLRGDLNSFIEDAVKVTRDHRQNLHHPVTRDHQLAYSPTKAVDIDTDYHSDGNLDALEDLLLVVSEISGDNEPLKDKKLKGPIQETSATKWKHWRSFYDGSNPYKRSLFSSPKHFFGTLWNYLLGPLNLIETIIFGNHASWVASIQYMPPDPEVSGKIDYYALTARVKEHTHLSTKIGLLIHKVFSSFFWEGLVMGFYDGLKMLARLPVDLYTDFHRQHLSIDSLLAQVRQELAVLEKEDEEILNQIKQHSPPLAKEKTVQGPKPKPAHYAQPKVSLKPYHSHGIINSGVDGFNGFIDLFGHNMFAKHPFTATISSLGAATSFLAFFAAPAAVSLLGKGYVKFLLDQGYIWTKDLLSASLAGSFTNFKLIGAVMEGIEHGPDSWLGKGVSIVVKDPATAITYTTLSWMMGYAMVNLINIPGLSEELQAHIGDPPALTEIFGGAKVGILGYHLLASPHEASEALRQNYTNDCVKLYKKMQEKNKVAVSQEDEDKFRESIEKLISPEKMKDMQKELAQKVSPQEKNRLALMLTLASHKQRLAHLSPVLKAKLEHQLLNLAGSQDDANAISKLLDPEKHTPRSTLRSFIGRVISYFPAILRCLLSPLAALWTWSLTSVIRPWKELGSMLLDDITSTVAAIFSFTQKLLETIFNRLIRTLADILVNGIVARVASFFGYHQVTLGGYKVSAEWDLAQESLYSNTTGQVLNSLVRANTTPNPEVGLQNGIEASMRAGFGKGAFFEGAQQNQNKPPADPTGGLALTP